MTVAQPVIDLREMELASLRPLRGDAGVTTVAAARFVGRSGELASLMGGLDDAVSGCGRLFLLGGEAGMGKSRLAAELAARGRERGARVLEGRCWEAGGAPDYWPWVQSLRSYARNADGGDVPSREGAIELLRRLLPEPGRPSGPAGAPDSEADADRFRLFEAVAGFLGHAARARPLVVILEDLQAADVASLVLLRFVADHLGEMPVLIVAIHRDPEPGRRRDPLPVLVNELSRQPVSRRLHLVGLAEPDVARFIEDATGVEPPAALVTLVCRRTGGNPLFVGEMVESLVAQGQFRGASPAASWHRTIPAGLHELIGRRLGRLSPDCRRALSLASVVGREFRIDVLTRLMGGSGDELLATLEAAAAASLIDDVPGRLGRLRFSDPIMRDVLLAEVPAPRRMRLHREIGEALESLTAADSESHLIELAGHFLAAALPACADKTVRYAVRAAARAAWRSAHGDAARHYQMALEALDLTRTGDQSRRCEIMLGLAGAHAGAGDGAAAGRTYLQSVELAREHGLAEALARSALGYAIGGARGDERRDRGAAQLLEEALAALEDTDSALRAEVMATLAGSRWNDDRTPEQRAALSRRAMEMARRVGGSASPAAGLPDESPTAPEEPGPAAPVEAWPSVFRRDGEYWSIAFGDDAFRLKDTKGLGYIAQLLGRPGGEIHPLAMVGGCRAEPTGPRAVARAGEDELGGPGLGDAGEILDARARAGYQRRLAELRADLDEAESWGDAERAARTQGEIDFPAHELSEALGLGGRARRMGSPGERARQSVTKAVKAGLERIGRHSPALGNHLASTIRTGTFCSYTPDPRVTTPWKL